MLRPDFGHSPSTCVKLAVVGSHGDRVTHIEVHVTSACTKQSELALLLRPLYRQGVLYIPSADSIASAGTGFALHLVLRDQSLVLQAHARPVDPFARGLTTGGYPGFAVELSEIDSRGNEFIAELTRSFDGTLPFGVPTSALGDERILCRVQIQKQTAAEIASTQVATEPDEGEEPAEKTMIVGEQALASMMADERSAVSCENEPTHIAQVDPRLLGRLDDSDEATNVAPPAGAQALPLTGLPLALRPTPSPELHPLIRDTEGKLAPNPSYNGMPTSILFEPGEGPHAQPNAGTRTDFVSIDSINRPLIISTVAAALLGLLTGYLVWGGRDAAHPRALSTGPDDAARLQSTKNTDKTIRNDDGKQNDEVQTVAAERAAIDSVNVPIAEPEIEPSACVLSLTTNPAGAALFAKDAFVGVSPYSGPVSCDVRKIDVQHPGFVATQVRFKWREQAAQSSVELERALVAVTLNSVPRKAFVRHNGDVLGKTPLKVQLPAFETSKLTIARKGFRSETIEITPSNDKSVKSVRLRRKR